MKYQFPLAARGATAVNEKSIGDPYPDVLSTFMLYALEQAFDNAQSITDKADQITDVRFTANSEYEHGGYFIDTLTVEADFDIFDYSDPINPKSIVTIVITHQPTYGGDD